MKLTRKEFLRLAVGSVLAAGSGTLAHAVSDHRENSRTGAEEKKVRLGMAVDLRRCREAAGCDKCIKACHLTHNVPDIPNKRHEVKWLWKENADRVFPFRQEEFQQKAFSGKLPVLCNHCANPQCVRVCPTQATWKRADGVVMMDYHRCIGCRYCMAGCPYGSRSFNYVDPKPHIPEIHAGFPTRTMGVVEKCNFCEERLTKGQLPACVEACPQGALAFGDLNDENSAVRKALGTGFSVQRRPELGCGPSIFYLI